MAGQVKHRQIFSGLVPDLKLMGLLARLAFKNTDSLIGAVADTLEAEGIRLLSSVEFLGEEMATAGCHDPRVASRDQRRTWPTAGRIAIALAGLDLGQTVSRQGPGRGGPRGDGGNGRGHPSRRPFGRARGRRGEGGQAAPGPALRRPRGRTGALSRPWRRWGRPCSRWMWARPCSWTARPWSPADEAGIAVLGMTGEGGPGDDA